MSSRHTENGQGTPLRSTKLTTVGLAALLALGSLTALGTLPASASTSSGSGPASPAASSDSAPASPGMLKAMQRDLGLSRAQAERRFDAEHQAASLAPKARKAAGSAYGGSWFDEGSGRLTVGLTPDTDAATVRRVEATGATVRTLAHSARDLDATVARINRLDAPSGISGWGVDPVANTVTVDVVRDQQDDDDVRRFVRQARKAGPVTVNTVAEPMKLHASAGSESRLGKQDADGVGGHLRHDRPRGAVLSQYFDVGDETVWNPSNGASRLFRRQVAAFEAELGLASGIGPMENDECRIDPAVFEIFVNALLARHRRTSHAVVLALSEGFTATVLVLAERAGMGVDRAQLGSAPDGPLEDMQISASAGMSAPPEGQVWGAGLRERARQLGRRMPR